MAHIVCDGKLDCGAPYVMGSWTARLTVGRVANVIQKSVFLTKVGWPYDFCRVADWPTFIQLVLLIIACRFLILFRYTIKH